MSNVINWFGISVAQIDHAIALYEPVIQVSLCRRNMDYVELAIFSRQDSAPGGVLAGFDGTASSAQGAIIYLHTGDLAAMPKRIATASSQCVFNPLELGQGVGMITLFTDSEDSRVGLHQPAQYFQH